MVRRRGRLLGFGVVLASLVAHFNCAPTVQTDEQDIAPTAGGIELANRFSGQWRMLALRMGTCPPAKILNPFQGQVDISTDEHRIFVDALDLPGVRIRLSAANESDFIHRSVVTVSECRFVEDHRLELQSLTETTARGKYRWALSWNTEPDCTELVRQYSSGLDTPCEMIIDFEGTRRE
ncbi:MAG: hypothetical protein VX589_13875 [Myxococcota bacterium]|nr:hypothetical protein [Myxococcota bacterium]